MDHQDIVDLISAGKFEKAEELFRERDRRGGVSGHDAQIMQAVEKKVRARLAAEAPPVVKTAAPLSVDEDGGLWLPKVAKKAKKPSKTPGR
jgi:hypothetical protein